MPSSTPHRKRIRHYHEPGELHECTFSCYRMPLLTNDPTTGAMTINPQASTIFQRLTGGAATADPGAAGSVGAQATQDIPAGMKLQRNPKTGETRIVPQ